MTNGTIQRKIVKDNCRNRTDGIFQYVNQSPINYLQNILKTHPYLKLKPSSLLSVAVLYEYDNVRGTTKRKPWPDDLCGYIESLRRETEQLVKRKSNSIIDVNNVPDTEYDQDECINQSIDSSLISNIFNTEISTGSNLPGTLSYANCIDENSPSPFESLFNVDWTSYFQTPVFPRLEDFDEAIQMEVRDTYAMGLEEQLNQAMIFGAYPGGEPGSGQTTWVRRGDSSPGIGWEKTGKTKQSRGNAPVYEEWAYRGVSTGSSGGGGGSVGAAGFLWKPVSESSGRLVVLLPSSTRGRSGGRLTISGSFGSETANMRGETHNGGRPHFYFSRAGSAYGSNINVRASSGIFSITVPNGARRFGG